MSPENQKSPDACLAPKGLEKLNPLIQREYKKCLSGTPTPQDAAKNLVDGTSGALKGAADAIGSRREALKELEDTEK